MLSAIFLKGPLKIVSTFVVTLAIYLGLFIIEPGWLREMQDWANNISDAVRDVPQDDQSAVLWRTLTDSTAILAIFMTVLSRSIVELVSGLGGMTMRMITGAEPPAERPRDFM